MARVVVVFVTRDGAAGLKRADTLAHAKVRFGTRPRCRVYTARFDGGYVDHDGPVTCLWCAKLP